MSSPTWIVKLRTDRKTSDVLYTVLRNRLGIRDAPELEAAERELVAQRLLEPVPAGDFDLANLKSIHRQLFQDVDAWAGKVRTVGIAKDGSWFQPRRFIETGMADLHRRIVAAGYCAGLGPDGFAGPWYSDRFAVSGVIFL